MPRFMTQRDIREMVEDGELERDLREEGEMGEDEGDFSFTPGSFNPQCGHICTECGNSEEDGCDKDCSIGGETDYIDPEYDLEEWEEEEGNEGWVAFQGESGLVYRMPDDRMYRGA